mmetsp:Transcript_38220/g.123684  ORF Transcript_38220/g.123684 Transcript_38220/m.123684 type:complete len:255 (-) Transcript_38220:136-900(-)
MVSITSPAPSVHSSRSGSTSMPRSSASSNRAASFSVVTRRAPSAAASRRSCARAVDGTGAWSGSASVPHRRHPRERRVRKKRCGRAVAVKATTRAPETRRLCSAAGRRRPRRRGISGGRRSRRRKLHSEGCSASEREAASAGGESATTASARARLLRKGSRSGPAGSTRPFPSRCSASTTRSERSRCKVGCCRPSSISRTEGGAALAQAAEAPAHRSAHTHVGAVRESSRASSPTRAAECTSGATRSGPRSQPP